MLDLYLRSRGLTKIQDLGSGVSATTYLCMNKNQEQVVVKEVQLSSKMKKIYNRETAILKHLSSSDAGGHPNVVKYYHSEVQNGYGYIEQEYIPGIDVETISLLYGRTNSLFCIKFIKSLLSALEYIHNMNVYHLDLNHNNVIICLDMDDMDMPLTAKIIDFGISVQSGKDDHDNPIGSTLFDWPYNPDSAKRVPRAETLSCNDIWQAGQLLYEIAYNGSFRRFNPLARGHIALMYFIYQMPRNGGYPVPPDPKHKVTPLPLEVRSEIKDDLMHDQAQVAAVYTDYVLKQHRDPVYDFNPNMPSEIHDIIRLLLARKLEDCVTASDALKYIELVWDDANMFGMSIQKGKVNNCEYPCEDPLNSVYKHNCLKCNHCEWNDKGVKRGSHTAHCIPKAPSADSEADRHDALSRGKVWNPYRKTAEHIDMHMDNAYISNRYSFLFKDGLKRTKPVPGMEIKRRFNEHDFKLLNTDEAVLKVLEDFSYHPLQTYSGSSFFFDYFLHKKIPDDYKLLRTKPGFSEFVALHNHRTNTKLDSNPKTRIGRESKRWTYTEPPPVERIPKHIKPRRMPVESMSMPVRRQGKGHGRSKLRPSKLSETNSK